MNEENKSIATETARAEAEADPFRPKISVVAILITVVTALGVGQLGGYLHLQDPFMDERLNRVISSAPFDMAILGTSQAYYSFDTSRIDAALSRPDKPFTSLNAGFASSRSVMIDYFGEAASKRNPPFKYIVLVLPFFRCVHNGKFFEDALSSQKSHRWSHVKPLLGAIWKDNSASYLQKTTDSISEIALALKNAFGWSALSIQNLETTWKNRNRNTTNAIAFEPLGIHRRPKNFDEKEYEKKVAAMKPAHVDPELAVKNVIENLHQLAANQGSELILVVFNDILQVRYPSEEDLPGITIFNYNDPKKYPDLYKASERQDDRHVLGEGARRLTDQFIHDFKQKFMSKETAPEQISKQITEEETEVREPAGEKQ